jgi:hypothetical protein
MTQWARERSQQQLDQRWRLHSRCEAVVRQVGPHWGVYCREHGAWIQWIARHQVSQFDLQKNP